MLLKRDEIANAIVSTRTANIPTSRIVKAAKELFSVASKGDYAKNSLGELSTVPAVINLTAADFDEKGNVSADFRKELRSLGRALTQQGFSRGNVEHGCSWDYVITRAGLSKSNKKQFLVYCVLTSGSKKILAEKEEKKAARKSAKPRTAKPRTAKPNTEAANTEAAGVSANTEAAS